MFASPEYTALIIKMHENLQASEALPQKRSEPIQASVSPLIKELLETAAMIYGTSISSIVDHYLKAGMWRAIEGFDKTLGEAHTNEKARILSGFSALQEIEAMNAICMQASDDAEMHETHPEEQSLDLPLEDEYDRIEEELPFHSSSDLAIISHTPHLRELYNNLSADEKLSATVGKLKAALEDIKSNARRTLDEWFVINIRGMSITILRMVISSALIIANNGPSSLVTISKLDQRGSVKETAKVYLKFNDNFEGYRKILRSVGGKIMKLNDHYWELTKVASHSCAVGCNTIEGQTATTPPIEKPQPLCSQGSCGFESSCAISSTNKPPAEHNKSRALWATAP